MPEEGAEELKGCTVGVVQIPGGILFFKNRDLASKYLVNRVTVWQSTSEVYVLRGANLETGELEGVAIGVNRWKTCVANTHVISSPDVTYDLLSERLVYEVRARDDVPRIVGDFIKQNTVQGGRILVAAPGWTFLVEVFKNLFEIQEIEGNAVITNGFSLISHRPERTEVRKQSSETRLRVAGKAIQTISNINALKGLLRSHVPEKGDLSICNHRQDGGGTESSHIIQIQAEYVGWSSLTGFPCENDYYTVQLFQR